MLLITLLNIPVDIGADWCRIWGSTREHPMTQTLLSQLPLEFQQKEALFQASASILEQASQCTDRSEALRMLEQFDKAWEVYRQAANVH